MAQLDPSLKDLLGPAFDPGSPIPAPALDESKKPPGQSVGPVEEPGVQSAQRSPEDDEIVKLFLGPPMEPPKSVGVASGLFGSAARAAIETTLPVAGAMAGAGIGTLAGPAAPVAVPAGGAAGYLAGETASRTLVEAGVDAGLWPRNTDEMPRDYRWMGAIGTTVGGSIPFGAGPLAAAQLGYRLPPSFVGNLFNDIITYSAIHPYKYTAAEAALAGLSASLAGGSRVFFPESQTLELMAGASAGLHPERLIFKLTRGSMAALVQRAKTLTPQGQATEAGRFIQDVLKAAGEDPDMILKVLTEEVARTDIPGLAGTAAMRTGSPALASIEASLAASDPVFARRAGKEATDSLKALTRAAELLEQTGDPGALRTAAIIRREQFTTTVQAFLNQATLKAAEAAKAVAKDKPGDLAAISAAAKVHLDDALRTTQDAVTELYKKVPEDMKQSQSLFRKVLARRDLLQAEMLETQKLPAVLEQAIENRRAAINLISDPASDPAQVVEAAKLLTVGEVMKFRQQALDLGRDAEKAGESVVSRWYYTMADAALADMEDAGVAHLKRADLRPEDRTPLDTAMMFSKAYHDAFSRSFAGSVQDIGRHGERIAPELMLEMGFASGGTKAALQLRELEHATRFMVDQRIAPVSPETAAKVEQNVGAMLQAQERLIRTIAAGSIDRNGRADPKALTRFVRDNGELMERFPAVRDDIENAVKTADSLARWEQRAKGAMEFADKRAIIARVLETHDPAKAFEGAIRSSFPLQRITSMSRLARGSYGAEVAKEGFRGAIWDYVINSSIIARPGEAEVLSIGKMEELLRKPIESRGPSLLQWMQQEKLMEPAHVQRLEKIFDDAAKITAAANAAPSERALVETPDMFLDFLLRYSAVKVSGFVAGAQVIGHSLFLAQRASAMAGRLFEQMPNLKKVQFLSQALRGDPIKAGGKPFSLLESLLQAPATEEKAVEHVMLLHAYLVQNGYFGLEHAGTRYKTAQPGEKAESMEPDQKTLDKVLGPQPSVVIPVEIPAAGGPGVTEQGRQERDAGARAPLETQAGEIVQPAKKADSVELAENFVADLEKYREKAYDDGSGNLTIGYGRTKGVKKGDKTTEEQARKDLRNDLAVAWAARERLIKVPLTPEMEAAVISFFFNAGASNSAFVKRLNAGDYAGAADEFSKWVKTDEVIDGKKTGKKIVSNGLINRRKAEEKLFRSGGLTVPTVVK